MLSQPIIFQENTLKLEQFPRTTSSESESETEYSCFKKLGEKSEAKGTLTKEKKEYISKW